jgi:glycosyltransferase involved in cell wall biosynthesis
MNILFLVDIVPYPPNTGHKIRTFNIIKQLHNNGENNVFLLSFNQKTLIKTPEEKKSAVGELSKYCQEVHVLDIPSDENKFSYYKCLIKNIFQVVPYRVERYRSNKCEELIKRYVKDFKIDIAHFDKVELYGYASLLGQIPIVCTNHNVESELMKRRSRREVSLARKFFAYLQFVKTRKYEKFVLGRVPGFITCTDLDRSFIAESLGVHTSGKTIDNGVDVSHYQANEPEENYILIIGAQNKESTANFDATNYFMNNIWPSVKKRNPSVHLKIVGRDPDDSVFAYQRADNNVEVIGFVSDERPLIGKSLALIVPLRVGGGSRLKILTAMAMGKTIVSTSIGAEGIACVDGENIVIADDAESFSDKLTNVLEDADLRERLGASARQLAEEKYDWYKIGENLRNYYSDIVSNGR